MASNTKDFLGNEINIGDYVVLGSSTGQGRKLFLGTIERFTAKMIVIKLISNNTYRKEVRVYADEICRIDEHMALMFVLTHGGKVDV